MDTIEKVWTILIFAMVLIGLATATVAGFYYLYHFFNYYLEIGSFFSFILMFVGFPLISGLIIFITVKIQNFLKKKKVFN